MMNTKILHIKVILFVVLQCVFTSAVKGQDVACKVGEYPPYGFTSGLASQCSGISCFNISFPFISFRQAILFTGNT